DFAAARLALKESLAVAQELGHRTGIAQALTSLGHVVHRQGDYSAACALYEQCLPLWRALGNYQELTVTLDSLGHTLWKLGESQAAYTLLDQLLALAREGNWRHDVLWALMKLGFLAGDLG